jgi:hypothetical protein
LQTPWEGQPKAVKTVDDLIKMKGAGATFFIGVLISVAETVFRENAEKRRKTG